MKQKDYTQYTFDNDTNLEIDVNVYASILKALQSLLDKYSDNFDKYRTLANTLFAYLQKEIKDEGTITLKYNLFEFTDQQLRALWGNEIVNLVDLKFDLINEKGKRVSKKVKGKIYDEPFSPELTAAQDNAPKPKTTAEGQMILRILNEFQDIFRKNIDDGRGVTLEELAKKQAEPTMEDVKQKMEVVADE